MKWFTDPFKFGVPPHGGFCLGIERFTMALLKKENVKETTLFPNTRTPLAVENWRAQIPLAPRV